MEKRELDHLKSTLRLNPIVGLGRIQAWVVLPREQLAEREQEYKITRAHSKAVPAVMR